jgi:hypothetical protein
MKRFLFTILCLFAGYTAFGQDLIVTTSGDSLNCKITEVKTDAIFFRYDAGGNVVSLPMNQVASYKYDFYKGKRGTPAVSVSMRGRSELSFYLGGGMSGLTCKPDVGSIKSGNGGMFGVGYTWFVSGRWGIVTGIEAALYRAEYTADANYTDTYKATFPANVYDEINKKWYIRYDVFDFSYNYSGYSEKQSALFLQIPVMAQFQTGRFFASAGIKIGIPVSRKFDVTATNLTTSGQFQYENQTYDDFPEYGLGNLGAMSYSGKLDMSIHYAAALEAGGQWMLGRSTNLYVGAWLDYGLNNLSKTGAIGLFKPVVEYDHTVPDCLKYNSIVETTDKLSAMSVGLKVKLTFSL